MALGVTDGSGGGSMITDVLPDGKTAEVTIG